MSAVLRNRSGHHHVYAFTHGHQLRHFPVHLRQTGLQACGYFLGLPAIERRDEGSAFERDAQHGLERAVKNGIAGFIVEIRDQQADRRMRRNRPRRELRSQRKACSNRQAENADRDPFCICRDPPLPRVNHPRPRARPLPYLNSLNDFLRVGEAFVRIDLQAGLHDFAERLRELFCPVHRVGARARWCASTTSPWWCRPQRATGR